VEWCG